MITLSRPLEFAVELPRPLSRAFYERLIDFYRRQPDDAPFLSPIWAQARQQFTSGLCEILRQGDPEALERELEQLYTGMTVFGIDWGTAMLNNPDALNLEWTQYLVALGQNLGVIPYLNPEQPLDQAWDPEELFDAIQSRLGHRLSTVVGGGGFGARLGAGLVPRTLIRNAITKVSLRRLSPPYSEVLEIGGGTGSLAYLIWNWGTYTRYHLIDLPVIAVIQAYLLAHTLAEAVVRLSGEETDQAGRICVHGLEPYEGDLDLLINQDSLPEIPQEQARAYLQRYTAQLRKGAYFYSVNHESAAGGQVSVQELMREIPGMTQTQRNPSWTRAGWLEEVWRRYE